MLPFLRNKIVFIISLITIYHASAQYQMEKLDRGLVAVRTTTNSVFLSWRWLGTEDDIQFNVYKNGTKLNANPLTVSNFTDNSATGSPTYYVKAVVNGVETDQSKTVSPWAQIYYKLPLQVPPGGTTKAGEAYTYSANDCSVGDVDGDGEYEIFVKWDPSNSKDNSQSGYTGNVYIDCYKMNGTFLWRIDLGINIRAGAHYTQFLVYDFDNDGKAEMACKTADGTKDGKGVIIGSSTADYRNSSGYILSGPEFLTLFNGQTGAAMSTVNYLPARGTVSSWGDSYGNRVDRFIATVAYLDGVNPSMVFGRGYYTRLVRAAWDFKNGQLVQRWIFDSNTTGNGSYAGQGNHQLTVGDVDGDGAQEVINGASAIDNTGAGLYSNGHGHGDALHLSDLDPDRPGQEVWQCQEEPSKYGNYGLDFRDAKTGQSLWGLGGGNQGDIGRAMAADIDPRYRGYECWGSAGPLYTCKGATIGTSRPSINFGLYWDGDLLRELLDGTKIDKWNHLTSSSNRLATLYNVEYGYGASNNTTKANPCLSGDILGDWREEVILRSSDNNYLLIYTTTIPSTYKLRTLMHDAQYRVAIAWQNSGYNQPPHPSFYLGDGMTMPSKPNIKIVGTTTNQAPIINWNSTTPTNFCLGSAINLAATATDADGTISNVSFYNGATLLNTDVSAPYSFSWTPTTANTYLITAVATDNSGNKKTSATYTINVISPLASITSSSGTLIPYNGSIVLNASSGTGYTYQWKNGTTTINGATTASYTASAAGNYSVIVSSNGCSNTSNVVSLTKEPGPGKYIYNYDNSGNFSWSNTNSWTPNSVPRAIDTVVIRSGEVQINGLNHTAPVYVEPNGTLRLVTANSTLSDLILLGGTLKVFTSNPELILTANIKVNQASTIMAGSIATTLFTLNGSISGSANLSKTSVGILRLNGNNSLYKGNWEVFDGKLQVRNSYGIGMCGVTVHSPARLDIEAASNFYSLKLDKGAGVDLDNNLSVTHAVFDNENLIATTYSNSNKPTFIGGLNSLTVGSTIVSTNGATTFCQGNSVLLNAAPSASYQWKNNTTPIATNQYYTANSSGNYTVTVKNSNACSIESAPIIVQANPLPNANISTAGSTTICSGNSIQLNANTGTNLSYQWRNGTSNISNATSSTYLTTNAGSYNVVIKNEFNCTSTSNTIAILVSPTISVSISPSQTVTLPSTLTANTSATGITYKWYNGNTQVGTNSNTLAVTNAGNYSVQITNGICNAVSNIVSVIQNQPPIVSLTTQYNPVNNGSILINVAVSDPDNSNPIVEIYDGNLLVTTLTQSPYTYTYLNPGIGTHDIIVKVKDGSGNMVTKNNLMNVSSSTTAIQQSNTLQFNCYPNPYQDQLTVELIGTASYTITDILGNIVERGTITDVSTIGNELNAGHYILMIQTKDEQSIYKIIKQ